MAEGQETPKDKVVGRTLWDIIYRQSVVFPLVLLVCVIVPVVLILLLMGYRIRTQGGFSLESPRTPKYEFVAFRDIRLIPGNAEGLEMQISTTTQPDQLPQNYPHYYDKNDFGIPPNAKILATWCVPSANLGVASQFERLAADVEDDRIRLSARLLGDWSGHDAAGRFLEARVYVLYKD